MRDEYAEYEKAKLGLDQSEAEMPVPLLRYRAADFFPPDCCTLCVQLFFFSRIPWTNVTA